LSVNTQKIAAANLAQSKGLPSRNLGVGSAPRYAFLRALEKVFWGLGFPGIPVGFLWVLGLGFWILKVWGLMGERMMKSRLALSSSVFLQAGRKICCDKLPAWNLHWYVFLRVRKVCMRMGAAGGS
jgi:hypothetical protein